MTDPTRFIEVLTKARLARAIESYRAEITLTVTTRKRDACLEQALRLRTEVLDALQNAGLKRSAIEESNGSIEQASWSSSKHVTNSLFVTHSEISVLVQAMARVESVFAARKEAFWSQTKQSFKFGAPQPQYASDSDAMSRSLEIAIQNAQKQAKTLAGQAGLQLAGVKSITQLLPTDKSPPSQTWRDDGDSMIVSRLMDFNESDHYTALAPKQDSGANWYCVRFFVADIT